MNEAQEQVEMVEGAGARKLPLHARHVERGASMTQRDGWSVPASYGDPAGEYRAVREGTGAGLIDLSARSRIEVGGSESVMFLNGMITNDVAKLEEGAWMSAAFPNVQGRLIAFARVLKTSAQTFLFDTEAATHDAVLKTLQRFTLAGDFRVTDRSDELACLSVQGAGAGGVVRQIVGDAAANLERGRVLTIERDGSPFHLIRATHTAEDGFDLFTDAAHAAALYDELTSAGARPVGEAAFETLRVEAGIPRHGADITEQNVVLEAGRDEAVSFTKGCYVGQEIIARIHWRGHVAKRLAGVEFDTTARVAAGSALFADNKEAGRVTSSVFSPRLNRTIAIAMIRYAHLTPGTELELGIESNDTARARVVELPFVRGSWYTLDAAETTKEAAP